METFKRIITDVYNNGIQSSPRGLLIKELTDYKVEFKPYERFCNYQSRKFKLDYVKEEFLWYLGGRLDDLSITQHAKMWSDLAGTSGFLNSNYGHYVFEQDQFFTVARLLGNDKDTRRGSIIILNHEHIKSDHKDVPCTYGMNFRIRNNQLEMTVMMRSNDAIFGLANDVPAFSFIHEMMYVYVRDVYYNDLQIGKYTHFTNSMHIYERHFEMANKIANTNDIFTPIECPLIKDAEEVRSLISNEFNYDGEFTKWLITKK